MDKKPKVPQKSGEKGDLPETSEAWVSYINLLHNSALDNRRKYEFQWVINIAYYMGYQHLFYNSGTGTLTFPKDFKNQLTINRISSFIDARHSKLIKSRPMPRVIPNTTDPDDVNAAKNSDQALLYLWRKEKIETEYNKAVMRMLLTGNEFLKSVWDPHRGDVIKTPKVSED